MTRFANWLATLLEHGECVLAAEPRLEAAERAETIRILRSAFERIALDVAGLPIPFDETAAVGAAEDLAAACWQLVNLSDASSFKLAKREPKTAAAHLSADVMLRYLPPVWKRAKARGAELPPAPELDRLLRTWPLSGVLADLDGEPSTPPEFDHGGLRMLYAERFAITRRPGWLPPPGPSREWVERIFHERRLVVPSPAPPPAT